MGMYTEIYVNIDLVDDLPEDVLYVLKGLVRDVECKSNFNNRHFEHCVVQYDDERFNELIEDKPQLFDSLFYNGSYYTPNTSVATLSYDFISNNWSLLGKGDIKNYCGSIEAFFGWIAPYSATEFLGYSRYEESDEPTLHFRRDYIKGSVC